MEGCLVQLEASPFEVGVVGCFRMLEWQHSQAVIRGSVCNQLNLLASAFFDEDYQDVVGTLKGRASVLNRRLDETFVKAVGASAHQIGASIEPERPRQVAPRLVLENKRVFSKSSLKGCVPSMRKLQASFEDGPVRETMHRSLKTPWDAIRLLEQQTEELHTIDKKLRDLRVQLNQSVHRYD